MADELLSQAELDTLLSALEADEEPNGPTLRTSSSTPRSSGPPPREENPASRASPREKILAFDFKRQQPPAAALLRMLRGMHEGFARNLAAALSVMLRTPVDVALAAADQMTYADFTSGLDHPTCYQVLGAAPLEGKLFLDLSPTILFPLIDRMLGGGGDPGPIARRPLTEIELRLTSRVTAVLLQELAAAWQAVQPLALAVERVESDPAAIRNVPPAEIVFALTFELKVHESRGPLKLCIPRHAVTRLAGAATDGWIRLGHPPAGREDNGSLTAGLQQAAVELVARLAETKITSADLFNLHVGDIITTDKDVRTPIAVCLEGVVKFRAHPGALKGHKAFRIEEVLPAPNGPLDERA
jgi:flagellar motor switch protein FliM